MKDSAVLFILVLACLVVQPAGVSALPISGIGEYGGGFSGSLEYTPGSGNASMMDAERGSLLIRLTNTSEHSGFLLSGLSLSGPYLNARSEAFLGAGQTAVFYFTVAYPDFPRLTAESFLGEGSDFVVYFRDASGTRWDRARVSSVPEPENLLLLGIGLLALGIALRRRMM